MSFSEEDYQEFKIEAIELLDLAEETLLNLSKDSAFEEAYQTIFRCFHNLKGAAGMMEVTDLQGHTHEIETIFTRFKTASGLEQNEIDFFLKAIDGARSLLEGKTLSFSYEISSGGEKPDQGSGEILEKPHKEVQEETPLRFSNNDSMKLALSEFFLEVREMVEQMFSALQVLEKDQSQQEPIIKICAQAQTLKGASGLFNFKEMGQLAHDLEISLEKVQKKESSVSKEFLDSTYEKIKKIEVEINRLDDKQTESVASSSSQPLSSTPQEISSKEESSNEPEASPQEKNSSEPEAPLQEKTSSEPEVASESSTKMVAEEPLPPESTSKNFSSKPTSEGENKANTSVRVSVSLLDKLMALMGEMVLVRNQMIQYTNHSDDMDFHNLSKRLSLVTSEIQEQMMKTRMQPIGNVINKFQRVVRDLSQMLDKDIQLTLEGAETELDKSLLEAIKDPLTHIVRNSCDHGIETKEERKKSGKSIRGHIHINAFHEGGQVVIEIRDDGKGLHKEAIIAKAIERNVLNQGQAERMTDSEIYKLIFSSGFSTAKQVTNVSGRGVGMDVVATNIEAIGGTVEIKSSEGVGTSFFLKIPLTLAIVPALIVDCGKNRIAIPQVKLHELVLVDQSSNQKIEMIQGTPVFRLRGDILPLVDLRRVLGKDQVESKNFHLSPHDVINIAVIQNEGQLMGFIVDKIMDTADIVVKPLNKLLKSLQIYSGATVLGDGSVALILDIQGIQKTMDISTMKKIKKSTEMGDERGSSQHQRQDFLLVRLKTPTKHAILLNFVHRLEEFTKEQVEVSGHSPVVRYRGQILPLIFCSKEFHFTDREELSEQPFPVVVVERSGRLYGLVVENIVDTLQTTAEVQLSVEKRRGVVGDLNLDKELVVVIDPYDLIESRFPKALELADKGAA